MLRGLCVVVAAMACADSVADAAQDTAKEVTEDAGDGSDADDAAVSAPKLLWSSLSETDTRKTPPFDFLTGGMPDRLLYFTGVEIQRWSLSAYAGMQWTPTRSDRDGFILRLLMSDSIERYAAGIHRFDTEIGRASVMPGYRWTRGGFDLQFLAGLDLEADLLAQDGRLVKLRGKLGARATTDVWWEPTRLLMLQYSMSGTTIDNGVSARAAAGWRLLDRFWAGPEIAASRDGYGEQHRFGAHLTGFRTGEFEWSVAGGYVADSFRRSGAYGRFGLVLRPQREPFFDN